jgi:hypothetical protein
MAKISTVTSLQSDKANVASPTFTGTVTAPSYAVTVGGDRTFGFSAPVSHQAGNAGSVGLKLSDGGGYSGVFVENIHNGTYSSQEIVFKTAEGNISLSTEHLRIKKDGKIAINPAVLTDAVDDAAAAAAGVAVGELYRNGTLLSVRIT